MSLPTRYMIEWNWVDRYELRQPIQSAIDNGVLVPVTDERLSRAEWEATWDYEIAVEPSGEIGAAGQGTLPIHDPQTPCDIGIEPGIYQLRRVMTHDECVAALAAAGEETP